MLDPSNLLHWSLLESLRSVPGRNSLKLIKIEQIDSWTLKVSSSPSWSLLSPLVREERKGRRTFQITVVESLRHRLEDCLSGTDSQATEAG